MLVGTDERCARCGTLLRAGRTVCPSCGLDQHSPEAYPSGAGPVMAAPVDSRPAAPKKSICPACMASVLDNVMVEYEGSRICPDCHERMKGKHARKG